MKKIIYVFCFALVILLIIANSEIIIENIKFSFILCINNLFPSLIPFMLLSNILIKTNFLNELNEIFSKIMIKLFKVNKNCSFAFIMSLLSGSPSNAKYLKDLYDNKLIDNNDIQKCLNFCHFTSPIFILSTIGYNFLNDKKLGLIILISHFLSAFIIGFFNKKENNYFTYNKIKIKNKENIIKILTDSINNIISTLLLILGIITTFIIITTIINQILHINNNYKFIYGFIEVTQGLKYLSLSNFNIYIKTILSSLLISFGGVCIHAQVFSIIDNKKIRYMPYLKSRLIHSLISIIITIILIFYYQ